MFKFATGQLTANHHPIQTLHLTEKKKNNLTLTLLRTLYGTAAYETRFYTIVLFELTNNLVRTMITDFLIYENESYSRAIITGQTEYSRHYYRRDRIFAPISFRESTTKGSKKIISRNISIPIKTIIERDKLKLCHIYSI